MKSKDQTWNWFLTETLPQERPKRHVLPRLNIPSYKTTNISLNLSHRRNQDKENFLRKVPLQSFISTRPNIWSAALFTSIGFPNSFPGPTTAAWIPHCKKKKRFKLVADLSTVLCLLTPNKHQLRHRMITISSSKSSFFEGPKYGSESPCGWPWPLEESITSKG